MNRQRLLKDLKRVNEYVKYLSENEHRNFNVTGPSGDYLMPFFEGDSPEEGPGFVRPIEHPTGLFVYYLRMKNIIEKALNGRLTRDEFHANAPEYLEELVIN
jgi:hypothetical protein